MFALVQRRPVRSYVKRGVRCFATTLLSLCVTASPATWVVVGSRSVVSASRPAVVLFVVGVVAPAVVVAASVIVTRPAVISAITATSASTTTIVGVVALSLIPKCVRIQVAALLLLLILHNGRIDKIASQCKNL